MVVDVRDCVDVVVGDGNVLLYNVCLICIKYVWIYMYENNFIEKNECRGK